MSRATKRAHFEEEAEDDDEKMVDEVEESEEEGEEEEGEEEEGEEEEGEEDGEGAGDTAAAATASTTAAAAPVAASFEALGLDLRLLKAVRKLGLARPTAVQARCIPLVLQGKDVVARAPTGTGKTYAYSIPLLQKVLARQDGLAGAAPEEGAAGVGGVILVPTRELCQQVHGVLRQLLGHAGAGGVRLGSLACAADAAALQPQAMPDLLIATPSQLLALLRRGAGAGAAGKAKTKSGGGGSGGGGGRGAVQLRDSLHTMVIDEADLLLSYGYGDDIAAIGEALPPSVQTMLVSATITPDLDQVTSLLLHNPTTVDVRDDAASGGGGAGGGVLRQFYLRCAHADKFLVMYALFKLNRIPGRSLVFVNSVERGFRLKLFLEQFGVTSGVLNCELPLATRWHAIQAFNRGLFDIFIATDDPKLMQGRAKNEPAEAPALSKGARRKRAKRAQGPSAEDAEFGVSRGVDFCDVTAVINLDLPTSVEVYRHRIGRTARGGRGGTAISLVCADDKPEEDLLAEVHEAYDPGALQQFHVDMSKLAAFRYRVDDALRAVTRHAVKAARLKEVKLELIHSKKLEDHFAANPDDLQVLKHDGALSTVRKQAHLANVPAYLKPETQGATAEVAAVASSSRARFGRAGAKARKNERRAKGRDPLKSAGRGRGAAFKTGKKRGGGAFKK